MIHNSADMDLVEKLILDIFENKLMLDPGNEDVFIVDSPSHTKQYRAKIASLMFEKCKVASLNFLSSSVLSLFSTGRTNGLVIELGHGTSSVVPIYGGYQLAHAKYTIPIGGIDSTQLLEEPIKEVRKLYNSATKQAGFKVRGYEDGEEQVPARNKGKPLSCC